MDPAHEVLFVHGQQEEFELTRKPGDKVYGEPGIAIHQIVLIYKDGCPHCLLASDKLIKMVKEHDMAIYLIMKNYADMNKEMLKKMKVEHAPVVFINGRRADAWELPGFMKKFTDDCGC